MDPNDIFRRFLYEAPGDDPPPDLPQDDGGGNEEPPDLPAEDPSPDTGGDSGEPPDLGSGDDVPGDDFGSDDGSYDEDPGGENQQQDLGLSEKISAIMNVDLYHRFLELVTTISSKITQIKDNSDVLYNVSLDTTDIIDKLTKLNDNAKAYLKYTFANEDYGKNRLFFNKCLNLMNLLNIRFEDLMKKGIKNVDT